MFFAMDRVVFLVLHFPGSGLCEIDTSMGWRIRDSKNPVLYDYLA